jgi:hypothetical protein
MKKTNGKRRGRDEPMGHGVFAIGLHDGPGARRGVQLRNLPGIERMLGRNLLIAFIRAFNAAERITAFAHLLSLNSEHVDPKSLASGRNWRLLSFLVFGTLYEGLDALRGLRQAGIVRHIPVDCAAWLRLDEMRVRWARNPFLKTARHKFAHHLGDSDDISNGLDAFATGRRVDLFLSEGKGRAADSVFPIGTEILFAGLALDTAATEDDMRAAVVDQRVFSRGVQMLFCQALRTHGVKFSDRNTDPADRDV